MHKHVSHQNVIGLFLYLPSYAAAIVREFEFDVYQWHACTTVLSSGLFTDFYPMCNFIIKSDKNYVIQMLMVVSERTLITTTLLWHYKHNTPTTHTTHHKFYAIQLANWYCERKKKHNFFFLLTFQYRSNTLQSTSNASVKFGCPGLALLIAIKCI